MAPIPAPSRLPALLEPGTPAKTHWNRRQLLAAALANSLWLPAAKAQNGAATPADSQEARPSAASASNGDPAPPLLHPRPLVFPRDFGSHPDTAIEWWYITGMLQARQLRFGFQITFFRARVADTQNLRSKFAAKQIYFAHAAVTDVATKRLLHDQRIARSSGHADIDLAYASATDTHLRLGNWQLLRRADHYLAQASSADFSFMLQLKPSQPLLLQGDQGWSRKGPNPSQASFYYSLPQLEVSGQLQLGSQTYQPTGRAWLDHEWSQSMLSGQTVGWDWVGMNLDDGSALTAFRLRDQTGANVWAGGSWRAGNSDEARIFQPNQVHFTARRFWNSRQSGATYPVEWQLDIAAGQGQPQSYIVRALVDDQELDSRRSSGAIYWEGLSELLNQQGQRLGYGYLEMTGYAQPLRL